MKEIYKLKDNLLEFYRVAGWPLVVLTRVIIALFTIIIINLNMGTMEEIMTPTVIVGVALVAGVLPVQLGTVIMMCYTIGHVFAVSMVAAAFVAGVLVLVFAFGKLFSPKETYLLAAAFIMCMLGGIYAVPMALAMFGSVLGVVPVLGGVFWYMMISIVGDIRNLLTDTSATDAVFTVIEALQDDPVIPLTLFAIGISYVLGVVVKNMRIDESWKLGTLLSAGTIVVVMIIGALFTSANAPYMNLLIGALVGVILGLTIEIFVHNVDYKGAQQLRFEDEEYIYFVRAIPKKGVINKKNNKKETLQEKRYRDRVGYEK